MHHPQVSDHKPYIDLKDVSFKYPLKPGVPVSQTPTPWVFTNLTFPVNTSTRAVLVGPNGSGKCVLSSGLGSTL